MARQELEDDMRLISGLRPGWDLNSAADRDERGATFVEYALLMALIAVVCVLAVSFIGSATNESFSSSADRL